MDKGIGQSSSGNVMLEDKEQKEKNHMITWNNESNDRMRRGREK